jgi:hypothetical protein
MWKGVSTGINKKARRSTEVAACRAERSIVAGVEAIRAMVAEPRPATLSEAAKLSRSCGLNSSGEKMRWCRSFQYAIRAERPALVVE